MIPRLLLRVLLSALFVFAGTVHLAKPSFFLPIMPPWVSYPIRAIQISGIFELLGGVGLWIFYPAVQRWTGWELNLLLLAIFPANIYMAVENIQIHGIPSQPWMSWARLPLQPLLMLGVAWLTHTWPFAWRPS